MQLRHPLRSRVAGRLAAAFTSLVLGAAVSPAHAQSSYPTRPITLIAPFSVGGDADAAARNFASAAGQVLGQSIVVMNRTGASGVLGSAVASEAQPDGYTLLLARTGSQAIMPAVQPGVTKYKWDDFTFIGMLETNPYECVVNASSPYKTFGDLTKAMQTSGGDMNFGTAGVMTTNDLGPRLLFKLLKLTPQQTPTQVPFKGTGEASSSLLAGVTQFACGSLGSFLSLTKAGKLRILVTTNPARMPALPDVPTARELGLADLEGVVGWSAVFGPPKMANDVRDRIAAAIRTISTDPAWVAATATTGSLPLVKTPEETKQYVKGQYQLYRSLGESLNIVDSKM